MEQNDNTKEPATKVAHASNATDDALFEVDAPAQEQQPHSGSENQNIDSNLQFRKTRMKFVVASLLAFLILLIISVATGVSVSQSRDSEQDSDVPVPTTAPTGPTTPGPTSSPTTPQPTSSPTTSEPTASPSVSPTGNPTNTPTRRPSHAPTTILDLADSLCEQIASLGKTGACINNQFGLICDSGSVVLSAQNQVKTDCIAQNGVQCKCSPGNVFITNNICTLQVRNCASFVTQIDISKLQNKLANADSASEESEASYKILNIRSATNM